MDSTSIITQAANSKEEESISSGQDKGSPSGSSLKKHHRRSIFSPFFCCFRNYDYRLESPPPSPPSNKPLPLPPPPEENGSPPKAPELLLAEVSVSDCGRSCVVIDLDETLVHSSFKPIGNADFIVPVEIDGTVHQYADPVADLLDQWGVFRARLFRESCVFHRGNYVKDLSRLGRQLARVIIVDNSPASYVFHPENAVPVQSWFDDMTDTELQDLIPLFEGLSREEEVYTVLQSMRPT